jgi:hypothetical protein
VVDDKGIRALVECYSQGQYWANDSETCEIATGICSAMWWILKGSRLCASEAEEINLGYCPNLGFISACEILRDACNLIVCCLQGLTTQGYLMYIKYL